MASHCRVFYENATSVQGPTVALDFGWTKDSILKTTKREEFGDFILSTSIIKHLMNFLS